MWTLEQIIKLLLIGFVNLSICTEILIIQDIKEIKNAEWNETALIDFLQNSNSQFEWHICPYKPTFDCIEKYPKAYIILDLSHELKYWDHISLVIAKYSD
ncbi:unnamed protein product [Blepharisma stoltei]|uniref:Uncharacterized protein n=1 Tax=Blepharisma stoltei TaxID=1481888 RepID=A0AAU9J470_9CILI|nr:unnamed protein product [Blepharisma stoltei]